MREHFQIRVCFPPQKKTIGFPLVFCWEIPHTTKLLVYFPDLAAIARRPPTNGPTWRFPAVFFSGTTRAGRFGVFQKVDIFHLEVDGDHPTSKTKLIYANFGSWEEGALNFGTFGELSVFVGSCPKTLVDSQCFFFKVPLQKMNRFLTRCEPRFLGNLQHVVPEICKENNLKPPKRSGKLPHGFKLSAF